MADPIPGGAATSPPSIHSTDHTRIAQQRAEYTARVRTTQAAMTEDHHARTVALRRAFLEDGGTHLLDLSARSGNAGPSPSFLYQLLYDFVCNSQVVEAACTSIERFGFDHANAPSGDDTVLHRLVAFCTRDRDEEDDAESLDHQRWEEMDLRRRHLTRLVELLLAQPSCTHEIVMRQSVGRSCLSRLLGSAPTMAWLPMATLLLQKRRPIAAWQTWIIPRVGTETVDYAEFVLNFFLLPQHDAKWLLASANVDPEAQLQALERLIAMCARAPQCQIQRLLYELVSQLIDRSKECRVDSAAAPTALSALRQWIQLRLEGLPQSCLSARLRDDLKSARVSDVQIMALVHALEKSPYLLDLDEANRMGHSLLSCILDLAPSRLLLLAPVIPELIGRITQMAPGATMRLAQATSSPFCQIFASTLINCVEAELDADLKRIASSPVFTRANRPFARLQLALVDASLSRNPSMLVPGESHFLALWFEQLASHLETHLGRAAAGGSRLVREMIDHLRLAERITTEDGRTFAEFVLDRPNGAREWLASHEGSDWYDQASAMVRVIRHRAATNAIPKPPLIASHVSAAQRAMHAARRKAAFLALTSELPQEIESWAQEMQRAIEVHLIPDLARIALSFLVAV